MYDNITGLEESDRQCPCCKNTIYTAQSKAGPCELLNLPFWEVDDFTLYCDNCDYSARYIRRDKRQPLPLDAYRKVENSWDAGYEQHYEQQLLD